MNPSSYHQLGQFVVGFQHLESAVNDLIVSLAKTDDEVVRILINELDYGKRLKAADVVFARFVDLRSSIDPECKTTFHKLMVELGRLGERRNDLVHSRYAGWFNVHGGEGLLRTNSKLRASEGQRQEVEEELQPEAFNKDLAKVSQLAAQLEDFRLKVIDWKYPSGA
jgi:hypothetical protein